MNLKNRLKSGLPCLGAWVMSRDPITIEVIANSNIDWIAIDLEHAPISVCQAADLIRVGSLCGKSVLVRTSDHNTTTIKKVLDAGAVGIIVPDVRSPDQIKKIIESTRYPKIKNGTIIGNRGVGLARAQGYGRSFQSYYNDINDQIVVIPQIEHIQAVEHAYDIAMMDGVDALFIGPYDLSASMGQPGQIGSKEVTSAIEKIKTESLRAEKQAGIHCVAPNIAQTLEYVKNGWNLVAFSSDIFIIRDAIDDVCKQVNRGGAKL